MRLVPSKLCKGFIFATRIGARRCSTVVADSVPKQLPELASIVPDRVRNREEAHRLSIEEPELFWGTLAKRLQWDRPFNKVLESDWNSANFSWFRDGALNVSVNCLDRHAEANPDATALIWERDEPGQHQKISFKKLLDSVSRMGNLLRRLGVKKGDRVVLYMPVSPLAVAAMLGCARIGAVHSVVFAGFSAEALAARIQGGEAKVVITANEGVRGGKSIALKAVVDSAVEQCPDVQNVLVMQRTSTSVPMNSSRDLYLEEELEKESAYCKPESMNAEDPLFMLYTSGSTGKPKGVVHTQAGYLLYASVSHSTVFNTKPGDVFGCMADIGWITGHTYGVYGPLSNGITSVLFESVPTYPDAGRYWETVERLKITHFYGAPTALRLLIRFGDEWVTKYDRSSLKVLGSVGEPINHEAWDWYHDVVGDKRCMLVDTWWQSETGGVCIAPTPADPGSSILKAMAMRPFFGVKPVLMDEQGKEIAAGPAEGALCLASVWPAIARTIHGDHGRYYDTYFKQYPGYFFTGDGAMMDADGNVQITGRMDDVINVSGHRLGTAEVEDVLDEHEDVAESAVVSYPHPIKGEGIFAFVVLKVAVHEANQDIKTHLMEGVQKKIAKYAVPDKILICEGGLPKTRSGKIMRRILRKIACNEPENLGDISTLAEPSVVETILGAYKSEFAT